MPRIALDASAIVLAASAAVLALPRDALAPGGVLAPSTTVLLIAAVALAALLLGAVAAAPVFPAAPATLTLVLAASLVGWSVLGSTAVPPIVTACASGLAFTCVPALVHLTLSWPAAWPSRVVECRVVSVTWIVVAGGGLAWVLFWDPFGDISCVLACAENPLAVRPDATTARSLLDITLVATVAAGLATSAFCLRPSRFWPGAVAALALAVMAAVRLVSRGQLPGDAVATLFMAHCVALALVGAAVFVSGIQRRRRHRRLARLAATLDAAPSPDAFAASLGEELGDSQLSIAYAVPERDRYVLADGSPFVGPVGDRVTTRLVRAGSPVAVIAHRAQDSTTIGSALGPAATLVIDNERLQAQLRSRLTDLRESRRRVVARADEERLRLERDLHDGAQQRLLMLGYEIRRAVAADPSLSRDVEPVVRDVEVALEELRAVAHGIYPGVLESYGLRAALDALADGTVPFVLVAAPSVRLPSAVERAAYLVVATAVGSRERHHVERGHVVAAAVELTPQELLVRIDGLGQLLAADVERLDDHVGALGGSLFVGESEVRCVLPCVSS